MSDLTFAEFRDSLERLLSYNWEDEVDDFLEQTEELDGCVGHILYDMFVLDNVLRVLSGESTLRFAEILPEEHKGPFYRCNKCEVISNRVDPLYDDTLACFEEGDPVPAGICFRCGDYMQSI